MRPLSDVAERRWRSISHFQVRNSVDWWDLKALFVPLVELNENDLSEKMPEKTAEMLATLHEWREEIQAFTREQVWKNKNW